MAERDLAESSLLNQELGVGLDEQLDGAAGTLFWRRRNEIALPQHAEKKI
jgi:hypothetical protein